VPTHLTRIFFKQPANQSKNSAYVNQKKEGATRGDALLNCTHLSQYMHLQMGFVCAQCLPGRSLSPLPAFLSREDALGSLFEVSENALMVRQDWIAGPSTTAAGDVCGLVLSVPQCYVERRIGQDDALQISHAGAPSALGRRPSTVVPEIVAIAHLAGDMPGDHFDHAGLFEILLGCRPAALCVPIKARDQLVDLLVEDVVRIQISVFVVSHHIKFPEHARNAPLRSIIAQCLFTAAF
jgi:hypothetical protein